MNNVINHFKFKCRLLNKKVFTLFTLLLILIYAVYFFITSMFINSISKTPAPELINFLVVLLVIVSAIVSWLTMKSFLENKKIIFYSSLGFRDGALLILLLSLICLRLLILMAILMPFVKSFLPIFSFLKVITAASLLALLSFTIISLIPSRLRQTLKYFSVVMLFLGLFKIFSSINFSKPEEIVGVIIGQGNTWLSASNLLLNNYTLALSVMAFSLIYLILARSKTRIFLQIHYGLHFKRERKGSMLKDASHSLTDKIFFRNKYLIYFYESLTRKKNLQNILLVVALNTFIIILYFYLPGGNMMFFFGAAYIMVLLILGYVFDLFRCSKREVEFMKLLGMSKLDYVKKNIVNSYLVIGFFLVIFFLLNLFLNRVEFNAMFIVICLILSLIALVLITIFSLVGIRLLESSYNFYLVVSYVLFTITLFLPFLTIVVGVILIVSLKRNKKYLQWGC